MSEKIKKTLYMPDWTVELLDKEGEKYDGPGVVVSAAILAFCTKPEDERVKILKEYRAEEIVHAYHDHK
jgi:hypothetical protein